MKSCCSSGLGLASRKRYLEFEEYGAGGQGCSLFLVFFLASKAPPWTRRPRLLLGLKTFQLFLDEIQIVFLEPPEKKTENLDVGSLVGNLSFFGAGSLKNRSVLYPSGTNPKVVTRIF